MTTDRSPQSGNASHHWTFFRAGGFDQVRLGTGADLMALDKLDPKLWVALSCPTSGLEFDARTLALIDSDGDGRIRVPEIIAAAKWAGSVLKDPDELIKGASIVPLSSINEEAPEGKKILDSAKQILKNLGKEGAADITPEDAANTAMVLAQTHFNGDGIIPSDAADDADIQRVISDIIACLGADEDRSGKPGISQERTDRFFAEAQAFSVWWGEAQKNAAEILPLGGNTPDAAAALLAVRDKVNDYFTRCRLAAFDQRAIGALNRQETEYIAIADRQLTPALKEISDFPVAQVQIRGSLPLKEGVNPAWMELIAAFDAKVVVPLLGRKEAITEEEWAHIDGMFKPYEEWLSRKAGASVEKLGFERIREILDSRSREPIAELIARDKSLEQEFNNLVSVEKFVRCYRDLFTLLNNFISFSDFYTRKAKAVFQAGTLYLDGRSCDLCVRVGDIDKHAALATLSRIYLTYCECIKRGGTDRMTIAAAFTDGDSDFLMVGRNGVFYDRQGNDWDATIVKVIEHPISIRQAFWSPYKKIAKMIGNQIAKLAAARDKAAADRSAAGIARTGTAVDEGKAPAPAFDVGKYAGIFAAIGLALGALGTAFAAVATGLLKLAWWQLPLVFCAVVLLISGSSMIIAWLKLRQRNLAPILDANGWAVNARAKINVTFGRSLTKIAVLPEGAIRKMEDPYADKKSRWPIWVLVISVLVVLLYLFYKL